MNNCSYICEKIRYIMEKLTKKEERIMQLYWEHGPMFVKDLQELCPDPRPERTTLSTQVRILESKGYLAHKSYGGSFQYYPAMTQEQYQKDTLSTLIDKWFGNSYERVVTTFVKDEKLSIEDMKRILKNLENSE